MTAPLSTDILVIGGGVNGASVARDAAGRGYRVLLAEMNDLASGTSSASTKLVHGGLRYLEYYEFRLVREALAEREVLWAEAPHVIWPLRFVLPHHKGIRPKAILRLGLAIYDHLGGRRLLPATTTLNLRESAAGGPLKPVYRTGFEYSDCWVDDARFVILNARDAADRGARIEVGTRVVSARRAGGGGWLCELCGDRPQTVEARMIVNAAGPWVDEVIAGAMGAGGRRNVRLVKGSHIVVRKLYDHDRCYIFQNADGRIIFAIPYQTDFTLIGTTDEDYDGDPGQVTISKAEIAYLLAAASSYFAREVTSDQLVWSYSGVRPLFDDGASAAQEATRDYVLKVDGDAGTGAAIHIFGGKLTTSRRLAEAVLAKIEGLIGKKGPAWTKGSTLPGGNFAPQDFETELLGLQRDYPKFPGRLLRRLMRQYGTRARAILGDGTEPADLGTSFGAELYQAEVDYLIANEWARTSEDILWRRTKLGLSMDVKQVESLDRYLASTPPELRPDGGQSATGPG